MKITRIVNNKKVKLNVCNASLLKSLAVSLFIKGMREGKK